MNPLGPWWGAPLFTLIGTLTGVVLTTVGAIWLDHRRSQREAEARSTEYQRETAFRWVRDKKDIYSRHLKSCYDLRDSTVWPKNRTLAPEPAHPLVDRIAQSATEIELITDHSMTESSRKTVTTARALADHIHDIQHNSKPGHQGRIDENYRQEYLRTLNEFTTAVSEFGESAKRDLDVVPSESQEH